MAKPQCGSPRRTIIHSRCSSGCSFSAGCTWIAETSRARPGSWSEASRRRSPWRRLCLAGRTEESLALFEGAVEAFRARQGHASPDYILFRAGRAYLAAGRLDEATSYAQEALALTRRLGIRGREARALSLTADVAATRGAENAEGYYLEAMALAQLPHCESQIDGISIA
jgi:tetratricopeptide (TPR) repeat protein